MRLFTLAVYEFLGQVVYGVGKIFPCILFVLGWLLKIRRGHKIGWIYRIPWFHFLVFYLEGIESCDQLFLSCTFGCDTWNSVLLVMASSHRVRGWDVELS